MEATFRSEQEAIAELIASKDERGVFVQALVERFGDSLSFSVIENFLTSLVLQTCADKRLSFKKAIEEWAVKADAGNDPSPEEAKVEIDLYTARIDNAIHFLLRDDAIAVKRIDEAWNNPSLIGLDDFSFDEFHHIGFNYGLYWYAITGTEPSCSTMRSLCHAHAEMIEQTLKEVAEQYAPKRNPFLSSLPYWLIILAIGFVIGIIINSIR